MPSADVLRMSLESSAQGPVLKEDLTLVVALVDYPSISQISMSLKLEFRECLLAELRGKEIQKQNIMVGADPYSLYLPFV